MTANGALEGHARALFAVEYALNPNRIVGVPEHVVDQARAVLLHELSLEPSEAVIEEAAKEMHIGPFGAASWGALPKSSKDNWRQAARNVLKASRDARRQEIKDQ